MGCRLGIDKLYDLFWGFIDSCSLVYRLVPHRAGWNEWFALLRSLLTEVPLLVVRLRLVIFIVLRVTNDLYWRRDGMYNIAVGLHRALPALTHWNLLRKDIGFILLLHKNPIIQPILQTLLSLLVIDRIPGQYFLYGRKCKIHVVGTGIEYVCKVMLHSFLNNVDDFFDDAALTQPAMVFLVD